MDKSLRNTLRNTVTHCRRLLEDAIAELLQGQFGIHLNGKIEDAASLSHLSEEDRAYRAQILVHLAHIGAGGQKSRGAGERGGKGEKTSNPPTFQPSKETVAQLIREVAFTHLNRLAAYKMMETRGLIRESVSRGIKSQGFLFYLADHPEDEKLWSSGQQERAYRHFLTWLGSTLSQEIGVLFSPDDPANRLLPPQRVLDQVLDLLNSADLATIWAEDETIGWIYQYFTPKELRDQARSESQAPRNSYELAFRNQFYTPRYVVQFLTDNTLGRIWYEMCRGETALVEKCQYLVRRPNEVFLTGDERPETGVDKLGSGGTNGESANGEIANPVYVPYRIKNDPRDLKILDPASGSGHFLLYCFDLLEIIYEEAYADPDLGLALQADYPTLADLRQAIPALILRHNLHGIDIDPRAVQIASLALWLRAKKRPDESANGERRMASPRLTPHGSRITKMNIVCAEPMPGNAALLDEFTADLQPPLLGQLLRAIVGKMELAGEAGSLLKIEEEIDDALAAAKKQWLAGPKPEQLSFFPQEKKPEQLNMFDLTGISNEQFWEEAEGRLLAALRDYAEHASGEAGLARRLFADDTARGFAFIDLCRQHFDVVLMNPPFGQPSQQSINVIRQSYPVSKFDLFAEFLERGLNLCNQRGFLGAITTSAGFYRNQLASWRESFYLNGRLSVCADLGGHVLDEATVRAAAYVTSPNNSNLIENYTPFFRCNEAEDKTVSLLEMISALRFGTQTNSTYILDVKMLRKLPGQPLAYWLPIQVRERIEKLARFSDSGGAVQFGLSTKDDTRFLRLAWEVPSNRIGLSQSWCFVSKGGQFSPYYFDIHLVIRHEDNFALIERAILEKYPYLGDNANWVLHRENHYYQPGITFQRRTNKPLGPRVLPRNCVFTDNGPSAFWDNHDLATFLALFNSSPVRLLAAVGNGALEAEGGGGANSYEVGVIGNIVVPELQDEAMEQLHTLAHRIVVLKRKLDSINPDTRVFVSPLFLNETNNSVTSYFAQLQTQISNLQEEIINLSLHVDRISETAYGFGEGEIDDILSQISPKDELRTDDDDEQLNVSLDKLTLSHNLLSWDVGCILGRWDIRIGRDIALTPEFPDPFDPLPNCSPGTLIGTDGLPATSGHIVSEEWLRVRPNAISLPPEGNVSRPVRPTIPDSEYPLAVDWDGILVDDPDHPDDLLRRVREVIEVLWGGEEAGRRREAGEEAEDGSSPHASRATPEEIEREACEILGVRDLRAYFRNPGNGGFWQDHIKRYSKSRRKAPIYWLLQSSRKNYALWLYYHRLDKDILYKALVNYVEPKIRLEKSKLEGIRGQLPGAGGQGAGASGRSQKVLEKELDQQESFVTELHDFRDKLRRAANLNLEPDLNDGVVLNIAPLWELVPWKEARQYWEELLAGKYEWSSVGRHLREKGLVKQG